MNFVRVMERVIAQLNAGKHEDQEIAREMLLYMATTFGPKQPKQTERKQKKRMSQPKIVSLPSG